MHSVTVVWPAIIAAILLIGCGGGGSPQPPVTPPPPPPPPSTTKTLPLEAAQLVYDPARGKIYASVAKTDKAHPNTVVIIDAATAAIEKSIAVNPEPNRLALSKGAKYLYVGEDEGGTVARIDLAAQTVDQRISLGSDSSYGTFIAGDLEVMPGRPETVAVARALSRVGPRDVVVFDDDVQRPAVGNADVTDIAFSETGDTLFGYDGAVSSFAFVTMHVDSGGVTVQYSDLRLLGWGYGGSMAYDSGRAYSTYWMAADTATRTVAGKFDFWLASNPANSIVAESGMVYFLISPFEPGSKIVAFDANTFLQTASVAVPRAKGSVGSGPGRSLVKCGTQGFAFIAGTTPTTVVITTESLKPVSSDPPTLDKLIANRLAYSPLTKKMYASVPSKAGATGNSVAVIDPTARTIETYIPVGSEPNAMAVSDDGNWLYVGLDQSGAIAKINLSAQTVDQHFSLGSGLHGPIYAYDIAVMPGHPDTIAVGRKSMIYVSPNCGGVALYDNGVQRPKIAGGQTVLGDVVTFGGSTSLIYTYCSQDDLDLVKLDVDDTGATAQPISIPGLVRTHGTWLHFADGHLYTSKGAVIDAEAPGMAGMFSAGYPRGFALDLAQDRAYFLTDDVEKAAIYQFDHARKNFIGFQTLPVVKGDGHDLVQCGENCFAVAASNGIVITDGVFAPAPDPGIDARNLTVNHMVYDAGRQRIYASVPGSAGLKGNSIAVIDPTTATITSSFYVGSEPGPLALSRDGSSLYVGLDGDGSVVKIDLASQSPAYSFGLGMAWGYGPLFAHYMAVKPDDSDVVAVSWRIPSGWSVVSYGVASFDHGAQLPYTVKDHTVNSITFGDSPSEFYGYNRETSGSELYRLSFTSWGVSVLDTWRQLISGGGTISYDSGMIYATDGSVVSTNGVLVGRFTGVQGAKSLATYPGSGEIFFLTQDEFALGRPTNIVRYDKTNFTHLGTHQIPGITTKAWDLIRYNVSEIAFATENGHIVFSSVPTSNSTAIGSDQRTAK